MGKEWGSWFAQTSWIFPLEYSIDSGKYKLKKDTLHLCNYSGIHKVCRNNVHVLFCLGWKEEG